MYSSLMIHFATWYLVAWYFTWAVGLCTSPYLYYKSLLTSIKVAVLEVSVANLVTLSPNLVSFQTLLTTLFQKPRVPNVVTFSGGTGDFWRLWHESTYCSYSSQQAACAAVGPSPSQSLTDGPVRAQQPHPAAVRAGNVQPSEARLQMNHACKKLLLVDPSL